LASIACAMARIVSMKSSWFSRAARLSLRICSSISSAITLNECANSPISLRVRTDTRVERSPAAKRLDAPASRLIGCDSVRTKNHETATHSTSTSTAVFQVISTISSIER
jgi:hypothetical protein